MKNGKIKDSLLEALKGTQIANKDKQIEEKSLKKEEFFEKLTKIYDEKYIELLLDKLIEENYIRKWDNGNKGIVYALDVDGELKLKF